MIVPHVEVEDGEVPEDQSDELLLLCHGVTLHGTAMTDTQLTVQCEGNVTCTALDQNPGATIVSPILLSLSGVAGQIWALYYLYTTTRPQHSRTVFFVLLSTLIWTDLIGKIITTPPALIAYSHKTWVGGVPLCNFHGFSMMLISLVTHLLVSTMAVERFIGIRHGYFYNKNITTSRTKVLLLGIWLFSVLFCAMPLFGVGQYALQYPGSWCFVNIHVCEKTPLHHRIYTNIFGSFTVISLIVMVVCNVVVITTLLCLRLCRHRCTGTKFSGPQRNSKHRELEMQMVLLLLVITIVFLISWSPIDMRLFLNQIWPHKTKKDHMKDLIAVRLTSINQIIDPWAYIICRKVFTTRVWRWLRKPLLGRSWLLRRESSSLANLGSRRKISRTLTPGEKKIEYKSPFHGEDIREISGGVVIVDEINNRRRPPSPIQPVASQVRELEVKDIVEIFRDSGTGSNNTPSTFCSDSGNGNNNNTNSNQLYQDAMDVTRLGVVPIPVFMSQQYRVGPPSEKHNRRVRRICSSASARSASNRHKDSSNNQNGDAQNGLSPEEISGRRHSWCCPQDALTAKHYRTQSTQTFKGDNSFLAGPSPNDFLGSRCALRPEIILTGDNSSSHKLSPNSFYTPTDHFNWSHRCDFDSSDQFTSQFQSDSLPDPDDDPVFVVASSSAKLRGMGSEPEKEKTTIFNFNIHTSTPIHRTQDS
ncbi:prostaglandin E2 receptor EP4 subtype-like isoform X2 [Palaemon carinicauda]|uniref:prostaglandin E2 receptor EP4 subtype-like isoform X2 n=1 Tax=Palaemon carinicauda TaxID=392227 RepID=UPI0035B5CA31